MPRDTAPPSDTSADSLSAPTHWNASKGERRNLKTRPWATPGGKGPAHALKDGQTPDGQGDDQDGHSALNRILSSPEFKPVPQLRTFLEYIVLAKLEGRENEIKGYSIAVNALGRDPSFDPVSDPIVRVEAARLRRRLTEYYNGTGCADPVEIVVPKGTYLPKIRKKPIPGAAAGDLVFLDPLRQAARPSQGQEGERPQAAAPASALPWATPETSGSGKAAVGQDTTGQGSFPDRSAGVSGVAQAGPIQTLTLRPQALALICAGCVVLGFVLGRF
ncbi:hypothetical protein [Roseibium aquae]|nr:hypothetical protein [Roseibium aquae]